MGSTNDKAREIFESTAGDLEELKLLIKELKGDLDFGIARKVLEAARSERSQEPWIVQQLALCTYKDEELPPLSRFEDALELLESIGLRDQDCNDSETLALGGAVYKRRFQYRGQLEDIYESLAFYREAWRRNPQQDMGYGGINAAYILDVMSARARQVALRSGATATESETLAEQAKELRHAIIEHLEACLSKDKSFSRQDWFAVTLAEAYFGLRNFDKAGEWLAITATMDRKEWQQETTFRQLVSLARLQGQAPPPEDDDPETWAPPWQALRNLLGAESDLALSCFRGKVGLGLSGGGFRASFYHLGVLARLAEMDVLRGVDVLSTVSGGSIVGAHYYLELEHLLRSRADRSLGRQDYIDLVGRVQEQFLAGVQKNLRVRALTNIVSNFKMLFTSSYTRSHRIGELYDTHFYARVKDGHPTGRRREMPDLLIAPYGVSDEASFKPKFSNWRRRSKVPILLLNTTSLNSGHNWHFTARWMGEPPGLLGAEVDINERYRRLNYEQAPTNELQHFPLGSAVAASSCVPGLFDPLVIEGLYEKRTVRLVDGGVHDNQGVAGLLDEACTLILCSDASGQMDDQQSPGDGLLSVPLRANSVMMDRVREAQFTDLKSRAENHALDGLFFVHLKQDLAAPPVDWIKCQDPSAKPKKATSTTPYGIDRDIQHQLAGVRTDLDSFTEVEAYSLMLSGYLMTEHQFKELQRAHKKYHKSGTWGGYDTHAPRGSWPFLPLEEIAAEPESSLDPRRADLGKQLDVASSVFFKAWKICNGLKWLGYGIVGAAAVLLIAGVFAFRNTLITEQGLTVGQVAVFFFVLFIGIMIPVIKWLNPHKAFRDYLQKAVIAVVGFVLANTHIFLIEPCFLKRGRLKRLLALRR